MIVNRHVTNHENVSRSIPTDIVGFNVNEFGERIMAKKNISCGAFVRNNGNWEALSDETGLSIKDCRAQFSLKKSKLRAIVAKSWTPPDCWRR
jgi:translation elongation factor EF-1alpha